MKTCIKLLLATFFLFSFFVATLLAHPPTDLKISYDSDAGVLHISMTHVTSNIIKHHIRKIQVFKNDEVVLDETIAQQTSPNSMTKDVLVSAAAGDTIRVKAICSEAGIIEGTLVIPVETQEQPAEVKEKPAETPEQPAETQEKEYGY